MPVFLGTLLKLLNPWPEFIPSINGKAMPYAKKKQQRISSLIQMRYVNPGANRKIRKAVKGRKAYMCKFTDV